MTCYNRVETTLRGLESLFAAKTDDLSLDVWLVDDASPDATGRLVKERFPSVHVIQSSGNLFWCKGMHLAWDSALAAHPEGYDYYLWLNDDVVLKTDALETLLAEYEKGKGVVVGKFSSDASERDVSFGLAGPSGDWMHGNLVLIPSAVYEKVGTICGDYHHAYGDHDYGLRAKAAGFDLRLTERFCGVCPQQPERYHALAGRPLLERFKLLGDPKGYNLHDAVLFRYRNWGAVMAMVCFCHMILRAICPR